MTSFLLPEAWIPRFAVAGDNYELGEWKEITADQVAEFLAKHKSKQGTSYIPIIQNFKKELENGSRHDAMVHAVYWVAEETAAIGDFDPKVAFKQIYDIFQASIENDATRLLEREETPLEEFKRAMNDAIENALNKTDDELEAIRQGYLERTSKNGTSSSLPFRKKIQFLNFEDDVEMWFPEYYLEPWLPTKGVRILAGNPHVGKSTLIAMEVAYFTAKLDKKVLLYFRVDEEPGPVKAKLKAAGAKLKNVEFNVFEGDEEGDVTFYDNLEILRAQIKDRGINVIYLDPANAYLNVDDGKAGSHGEIQTRLKDVNIYAAQNDILITLVKHMKKDQIGSDKLPLGDKIFGSSAWREVPRYVHILWQPSERFKESVSDFDDLDVDSILIQNKNSYHQQVASRLFRFESVDLTVTSNHGPDNRSVGRLEEVGSSWLSSQDIQTIQTSSDEQNAVNKEERSDFTKWAYRVITEAGEEGIPTADFIGMIREEFHYSRAKAYKAKDKLRDVWEEPIPDGKNNAKRLISKKHVTLPEHDWEGTPEI